MMISRSHHRHSSFSRDVIGRASSAGGAPTLTTALDCLRELSKQQSIIGLIDRILNDDEYCSYVSSKSYHHANNFDKIVLVQSKKPEFKVRLHVWWPPSRELTNEDDDIHNHCWSFASTILSGTFSNELFQTALRGTRFFHYRYVPRSNKEVFDLKYEGPAALSLTRTDHLSPGSSYSMPGFQLHRFRPTSSEISSTLIFQLGHERDTTDVYRTNLDEVQVVDSPTLDVSTIRRKLVTYRAFLLKKRQY